MVYHRRKQLVYNLSVMAIQHTSNRLCAGFYLSRSSPFFNNYTLVRIRGTTVIQVYRSETTVTGRLQFNSFNYSQYRLMKGLIHNA